MGCKERRIIKSEFVKQNQCLCVRKSYQRHRHIVLISVFINFWFKLFFFVGQIRVINYNLINLIVKGEEDLAKDVMIMLDTLTVEREGFWMVPELYKVPEDKVNQEQIFSL